MADIGCREPRDGMIELHVDQQAMQALGRALKAEADGNKLRRDLAKRLRAVMEPVTGEIRSGLMAMPTSGALQAGGGPLRAEVLKHLKVETRFSGRATGVRVRIKKRGPRGFALAARRLNRKNGWRHQLWGRDVWVRQVGKPDYFDDPIQERAPESRRAVLEAMNETAKRIADRARTT